MLKILRERCVLQEAIEEWRELCRQAAVEQDPQKLMELSLRIVEMLEKKQTRLNQMRSKGNAAPGSAD